MQFIMFVCPQEDFAPDAELDAATDAWVTRFDREGVRLLGDVLEPESAGVVVGDGPTEVSTKIAGFDVLECRDLAHAAEVAAAHPMTQHGSIVIRPFMEI